jgi:molybdenum cofactor biosynthesis enzyme MoaA
MNDKKPFRRLKLLLGTVLADPVDIVFEMSTVCNRRCTYCPVTYHQRHSAFLRPNELAKRLAPLHGFKGGIWLGGYCEPLIDLSGLVACLREVRKVLPDNKITVTTNGDYLDSAIEEILSRYVTTLLVTRHDTPRKSTVRRSVGAMTVIDGPVPPLMNRAGSVDVGPVKSPRFCMTQYTCMITCDGKVAFCCNEYDAKCGSGFRATGDWLKEWRRPWRRLLRFAVLLGYRPIQCRKCGFTTNESKNKE